MLVRPGVATSWDAFPLERYCDLLVRYRRLADYVAKNGEVFEGSTDRGSHYIQQRPEVGIINKLATMLLKLEQEFGLTPSARAKIVAGAEADNDDPEERFFKPKVAG
jgi:P27 family predicted phage terminase small subunit